MDSGNSESLQSSSGGDEEYDSRGGYLSHHHLTQSQPPNAAAAAVFSPLLMSNYFDPASLLQQSPFITDQNSVPFLNLDMIPANNNWSKTLRPDPDPCSPQNHQINNPVFPSSFPNNCAAEEARASGSATSAGAVAGKEQQISRVMRNPKKRSRASRRAPTTVLTTDTTNFRAMVQEFTGIPAPPFASTSPFPRTRFDFFGAAPSASALLRSAAAAGSLPQTPYLRRPFPQKINIQQPLQQPPPFLPPPAPSSSSLLDSLPPSSTANNNLFTIQHNSILSSLLQSSSPKYPRDPLEIPSNTPQLKMGSVLDGFGSVNTALTGLPSLISPDQPVPGSNRSEPGSVCWGGGGGDDLRPSGINDDQQLQQLISSSRNAGGGDANNNHNNFPTASPNFQTDKAPENAASGRGGEGMTESWICSSNLK